MSVADFISLNVPGMLERYANPRPEWRAIVLALAQTQLAIFRKHDLIRPNAAALTVDIERAVVRFSDLTTRGQKFVMSGQVDKWLSACDRSSSLAAYQDFGRLERRVVKFFANQ